MGGKCKPVKSEEWAMSREHPALPQGRLRRDEFRTHAFLHAGSYDDDTLFGGKGVNYLGWNGGKQGDYYFYGTR